MHSPHVCMGHLLKVDHILGIKVLKNLKEFTGHDFEINSRETVKDREA